jgi:hypothetical protein
MNKSSLGSPTAMKTTMTLAHQRRRLSSSLSKSDCISYQSGEPIKPVSLPTNQEYAALSYAWGEDDKKQSGVSESTAPVINDSIEVTKRLGYKYLWVDRHVR